MCFPLISCKEVICVMPKKLSIILGFLVLIPVFLALSFLLWSTIIHHRDWSAYDVKAKADVSKLGAAISLYKLDNGSYPDDLKELEGDYLKRIQSDPWGNSYGYISTGDSAIIFTNGEGEKMSRQIFHVESNKYD